MRLLVFLAFCSLAVGNRNHHGNRRRNNMLDQNRTPQRELAGEAENLFEAIGGTGECDLNGAWYNQHGSEMILNQTEDGTLTGEYRSAVKLSRRHGQDYSERTFAAVRGEIFGKMFTFHVYWRERNAVTTWSGQCQRNCDLGWLRSDRDILHASWLLTTPTSRCDDYWSATRIGEDIFTRSPMKSGPRRAEEIDGVVQTA